MAGISMIPIKITLYDSKAAVIVPVDRSLLITIKSTNKRYNYRLSAISQLEMVLTCKI